MGVFLLSAAAALALATALRGGGDTVRSSQPFLTEAPPARLAVLPASSHIDVFGDPVLLAAMIVPFLDDQTRPPSPAFF